MSEISTVVVLAALPVEVTTIVTLSPLLSGFVTVSMFVLGVPSTVTLPPFKFVGSKRNSSILGDPELFVNINVPVLDSNVSEPKHPPSAVFIVVAVQVIFPLSTLQEAVPEPVIFNPSIPTSISMSCANTATDNSTTINNTSQAAETPKNILFVDFSDTFFIIIHHHLLISNIRFSIVMRQSQ